MNTMAAAAAEDSEVCYYENNEKMRDAICPLSRSHLRFVMVRTDRPARARRDGDDRILLKDSITMNT